MDKTNRLSRLTKLPLHSKYALLIGFLVIMAGFAIYLVIAGEPNQASVGTENSHSLFSVEGSIKKQKKKVTGQGLPAPSHYNDTELPILKELIDEFEYRALQETDAIKIRVESRGADTPGYVAFMAGPDGLKRGIPEVMKEIAAIYLETFPDAPRITVSLIIGGGVRGRQTFLKDDELGVIIRGKRKIEVE